MNTQPNVSTDVFSAAKLGPITLRNRVIKAATFEAATPDALVTVSPHNYNSTTVGLAATVHVSAAIPNVLITEYFVNFEARGREIARPPIEVREGSIDVPSEPGLGIELDEAALTRLPARPSTGRTMPAPGDEAP